MRNRAGSILTRWRSAWPWAGTACASALSVIVGASLAPSRPASPVPTPVPPVAKGPVSPRAVAAGLPLGFEKNEGQFDPGVLYQARAGSGALALSAGVAVLQLSEPRATIAFRVVGARGVGPRALGPLAVRTHYLLGSDPSRWKRDVPSFSRISFEQILDGIDVSYHGDRGALEYDFTVAPGADPAAIAIDVQGAAALSVDERGALRIDTGKGLVDEPAPTVYQWHDGRRVDVPASFRIAGASRVGFSVASYDRSLPLVIDPVIVYLTGVGDAQAANGVAVDAAGNAYVTGSCPPGWLPSAASTTPGTTTAAPSYVAKVDPSGQLVYATYIGGNGNTWSDAIAVDSAGNAYTTGWTQASNLATSSALPCPGWDSAFVIKLDSAGENVVYAACLGGSRDSAGTGIAVDSTGHAYVTGEADSSDLPTKNALYSYPGPWQGQYLQSAFVAELTASGSDLVYGTFLAGLQGMPTGCTTDCCAVASNASGSAIVVDSAGNAYVTGYVQGPGFPLKNPIDADFPVWNGFQAVYPDGSADAGPYQCELVPDASTTGIPSEKAFVTEIASGGGSLVYSTYLGGNGTTSNGAVTEGRGIAVDALGNAFVTGNTGAPDFPVTVSPQQQLDAGYSDTFVTEIAAGGGSIVYSTVLAGTSGNAIAVDDAGTAYLAGSITDVADESAAFVAAVAPGGTSLVYATYVGGAAGSANAIAVDPEGNAIVAGSGAGDGGRTATMIARIVPGDASSAAADASSPEAPPADAPSPEASALDAVPEGTDAETEGAPPQDAMTPIGSEAGSGALRPDASPEVEVKGGGCSCNRAGVDPKGCWPSAVIVLASLLGLARRTRRRS